jgi:cytochrome c-type biogenesis protein CcmH
MTTSPARIDELKRQLAQLDGLIAAGTLTGDTARSERERLEREILGAVLGRRADATEANAPAAPRPSRGLIAVIAAFVLLFGAAGYAWRGNPEGWRAGPGDGQRPPDPAQIEAMVTKLADRMKSRPDDVDGWNMLARSYSALGRYADALPAYKHVLDLRSDDAQAMADYADALAMAHDRNLEGEPESYVMKALKADPKNVKALALAGTIAFNRAQYPQAVDYLQRAVQASDPASDFVRELQAALDEARKRAGMPALPPAAGAAAPAGAVAAAAAPAEAASAAISGELSLSPALKAQAAPDDTVFVFARAVQGPKMPLAILRLQVKDLPAKFRLDDSLSMSPAARLSSAAEVIVGARVSKTGNAMPQPGDLQALSAPVKVGTSGVQLEISDTVR